MLLWNMTIANSLYQGLGVQVHHRLQQHLRKTLSGIETRVKQNILSRNLILSGFMLGSVDSYLTGDMNGDIVVGADYSVFHEIGTRKTPPRPFFGPAISEAELPFYEGITEILRNPFA